MSLFFKQTIGLLSACEAKSNHLFSPFIPQNSSEEFAEPIGQEANSKHFLSRLGFQKSNKILISQVRFFDYIIIFRSTKMLAQIADLRLRALLSLFPYICVLMS